MIDDVCVIGGGASGLAAAIAAAREGASVLVLEQLNKAGKKILATGNGKCNLSNGRIIRRNIPTEAYHCCRKDFPIQVLNHFDVHDTLQFFESIGLYAKDRDGYIYPESEQASSVSEALHRELTSLGGHIMTDTKVLNIEMLGNGSDKGRFLIHTENGGYRSRCLILATGGKSGLKPEYDDNGGYKFCQSFGHRICPVVPALCALHCREKYFKELAGIRVQGHISLIIDGQIASKDKGELQLTAYGVSGIPAFQVSRYAAYGLMEHHEVTAVLDLMPDISRDDLFLRFNTQFKAHPEWTAEAVLSGMMNKKLAACLLKLCGIQRQQKGGEMSQKQMAKLTVMIKHLTVHINGVNNFNQSQVTAGGVDTKDICPDNLSSRLVDGLYIVGELLDVDGICGGYNLQWAWATGVLAGTHAGKMTTEMNMSQFRGGKHVKNKPDKTSR